MQYQKGNTLLFAGDTNALKPSLLFQFASHWAENGIRVSYLSATPLNELPTPIHGADFPSSSALNQIQFLYLPKWQDLMQHLFSLHCHALVPRAIIVNGLNHYCPGAAGHSSMVGKFQMERSALDTSAIAHICAALLDALNVCSARNGGEEPYCVCSYEINDELENMVSYLYTFNIFFGSMWLVESVIRDCCRGHNVRSCNPFGKCFTVKIKKLLTNGLKEDGTIVEFSSSESVLFLQRFLKILQS